jgi:hypothetical protein
MFLFRKNRRMAAGAAAALACVAVALPACGDLSSSSSDSVRVAATGASTAAPSAGSPKFSDPQTIDNRYLPLTAKKRTEHRGELDDGTKTRSVQTVLDKTKRFDVNGQQVDAVVIEDKAFENGSHVETALDYFAQADDGTVYYLGEDVTNVENGKVVDHKGTWIYGKDTDVLGVAMPANPKVGDQYRFEDVPGITTESNRVEEAGLRAAANGQRFTDVIRIQEFIQPEGDVEYKLYAPGVGKITEYPPDGRAELAG